MSDLEPSDQTKINPLNEPKDAVISGILDSDRGAFDQWFASPENRQKLSCPPSVARHFLIPQRTLEIAENPENVRLIIKIQNDGRLEALVSEHKQFPLTTQEELDKYNLERDRKDEESRAIAAAEGRRYLSIAPEPPPGLDRFLAQNQNLIKQSFVDLQDYVMHDVRLIVKSPDQLMVEGYWDRTELRGKRMALSFYRQLHEAAKAMGFEYIIGSNDTKNINFFIEKLGRIQLSRIRPEYRTLFHGDPKIIDLNLYTIDFLYPEEAEKFLIKE